MRPLSEIAREIYKVWTRKNGTESAIYYAAVPWLHAMSKLDTMHDSYGQDTAMTIVLYFLSNAKTWRGDDARRIKAELKQIAGIK